MEIEIKKLIKNFEEQVVLNIDKLVFTQGIHCIMGANGCGKTTLLNILSGQLNYNQGQIRYNGTKYSKDISKEITLVHQNPYLLQRNVFENIAYPLRVRKVNHHEIKNKVNEIIHKLNIEDLKHKKATDLSVGEAQKVSIARAIVFEPSLLMLDEPTSNIDEKSLELIESVILDYSKGNKTIIIVTHNSEQAKRLTNKIIQL